jgi:hypothetical protein
MQIFQGSSNLSPATNADVFLAGANDNTTLALQLFSTDQAHLDKANLSGPSVETLAQRVSYSIVGCAITH